MVTSVRLVVLDGPDKDRNGVGTDHLAVGSAENNTFVLTDPTVSRYHLEATRVSGGILLRDLGSTNGTYAGAVRIDSAVVPPGTNVTIGGTTLRFEDGARKTAPALQATTLGRMVASSRQMLALFADIDRIAAARSPVLVVGESGTGKELVASALHDRSKRPDELVAIDCGAIPSGLLSSELFGHERGAFTGADRTHAGAFERAGRGTVFLDEIGELPFADQATLLGVLERRRFRRVGGDAEIELRARVVAATNRDLRAEVNHNKFRHDLYYRLAVVVLRLPALRERPEDIDLLVAYFARELGVTGALEDVFGATVLDHWRRRAWPGNIRELRNAVESAIVMGPPVDGSQASGPVTPYKQARADSSARFELEYVTRVMEVAEGNVSRAARLAAMDRSHLIDLLRRHGVRSR